MPVIKRFGAIKICVFASDHAPPHFHILHAEKETVVRIADMMVLASKDRQAAIAEALEWAKNNKAILMSKWDEMNKRG